MVDLQNLELDIELRPGCPQYNPTTPLLLYNAYASKLLRVLGFSCNLKAAVHATLLFLCVFFQLGENENSLSLAVPLADGTCCFLLQPLVNTALQKPVVSKS